MSRTILITGANRGIGFELARQLSKHATVIGTARNPAQAEKLQALSNVHVVAMDITSPKSVEAAAEEVAKLAPEGIDELWNNAAQLSVTGYVTEAIDTKEWLAEIQTNVIGQSLVTRNLLPLLRKGQGKKLVFISSEAGSVSTIPGDDDKVVYCSSKAALNMTIKYWHHILSSEGFVVTPLHPGWVITDMGGENAAVKPGDSARGLIKVVEGLKPSTEMKLRVYDGSVITW